MCIFWNLVFILELKENNSHFVNEISGCIKNLNYPVLFPIGKEEEVVNIHPRAMFIPQDGWTFLAAGIFTLYFAIYFYSPMSLSDSLLYAASV